MLQLCLSTNQHSLNVTIKTHSPLLSSGFNHQSISQNLYSAPSRYLLRGAPDLGQAEKNSLEKEVELRTGTPLGGALDLLEVHSRFLDQPQKMNGSALFNGLVFQDKQHMSQGVVMSSQINEKVINLQLNNA